MASSLWEKKLKGGCENHDIWIRRLLDALFLALRNFANFKCCHGLSSGRCPGICIFISPSKLVCGIMDSSIVSVMRMSYLGWIVSISAWASTLYWRCISIVHWKTIFLICYLLDYQQVQENSNVSIILLGDKKEPTKWKTNLVQQILLPNNHFPCYFYFKNRFYWRKEKRCVTCLWLPTKANTQI